MQLAFLATLRETLEGFVTVEARLAATAVLLAAAGVTALLLAPRAVRALHRLVRDRVLGSERVPVEVTEFDWHLPVTGIVRTLQFAVVLATGLAALILWGYVNVALAAVTTMAAALPTLGRTVTSVALVAGALIAIDVLETRLDDYAAESDAINQHQKGIVFRVLQLTVLVAAIVGGLTVWGVNLGGLLVGAGFLGIVVGTAARSTIGSLIAGFVLMFSRPFELGDWVEIDGEEGIVADITVINTRIRTAGGEVVVIPNDRVANATVSNRTRLGQLRLSMDVGVDYEADLETAESVVADALAAVSHVENNPPPQVVPKSFGDSAVVLECRFWIDTPSAPKRALATAAVVREVKAALDDAGVKIPYPQRELSGRAETGGFRVADGEEVGSAAVAPPDPTGDD
ncbi:mechanosensitive ion channel family protein [Halobaculum magnesiiphilum]|uniref:Mechanosensitive ion channel family protein n=1 Tax=Halobaculum magnesiiphilum TaxID=1017351 RepID=A0A8T8WDP2_9EURY|nr:mechanosensitive ion channel family protein [Halobaculum magnesiiphilum]QZP37969.1 mechanosensitive ion channel family protein [Halobaculum magnesiiphilum]